MTLIDQKAEGDDYIGMLSGSRYLVTLYSGGKQIDSRFSLGAVKFSTNGYFYFFDQADRGFVRMTGTVVITQCPGDTVE